MVGDGKLESVREEINLGMWRQEELEKVIRKAAQIPLTGRKIDFISWHFLGTDYREGTLIGNEETPEKFVVDFSGVDCFTVLDYVEAVRLSDSFSAFRNNLARVRYRSGIIAFDHRNHFFSDWGIFHGDFIEDVTVEVGGGHTRSSGKRLNVKEDGTFYLPGITPIERTVDYIPASAIHESVLRKCKTGDYVGIYAEDPGLDVTHVGIFIRGRGKAYLRHASSLTEYRKVIDQDFLAFMVRKPGFLVFRPRATKNRS